jgi:hypothetical protein
MLNTIFTTFFEYQIGEPIWMLMAKAFNCLTLFVAAERLFDFVIRKWNDYQMRKEEEEMAKTMRPIGFR